MAPTFRKEKVEDLYDLIKIFLDQTNGKLKIERDTASNRYLLDQSDAYNLILKIMEKDFEFTSDTKKGEN